MKKGLVLVILFLGLVLFLKNSCSQTLSDWEFNVYYDYLARFFEMDDWTKENENRICREIAYKYNISYQQVYDIVDRAFEREPSDWEWDLGEELCDAIFSLPANASDADYNRLMREFGSRYNISRNYLNDILYRTIWDFMMWDF